MSEPKPFQQATILAAMRAFQRFSSPRRFLVADEVGLGKTVVAQGILQEMMLRKQRKNGGPLVVFYVCSSLAIAAQNRRKLLEALPESERGDAVCPVDRITLVGTQDPPSNQRLNLYTLTPDTSIPLRAGRSRGGRQTERALIFALIRRQYPKVLRVFRQDDFRQKPWILGRDDDTWKSWVRHYKQLILNTPTLRREFHTSIRQEFGLQEGQRLVPVLEELKGDRLEFIGRLRGALAAANLSKVKPDLIIFDEFQRFQDLVQECDAVPQSRVLRLLRGDDMEDPPALLLLSATPYKPYARRWEDSGGEAHKEFLELIQFLYGNTSNSKLKRHELEEAFLKLETELRLGRLASPEFMSAKAHVENTLRPVMSRTERLSHQDGGQTARVVYQTADLHVKDLRLYTQLTESFRDEDKSSSVAYWTSIPLPAQTMGQGYLAWKRRNQVSADGAPELTERDRNGFLRPGEWPHPRMRAFEKLAPPEKLALPWLSPSLPWWTLAGRWKSDPNKALSADGKLLVFSRFRAVPQAIAAFLSYGLECRLLRSGSVDYEAVSKRSVLQARPERAPLLALFHPSPWLVKETDPLQATPRTEGSIRKELIRQVKDSLRNAEIRISGESRRPVWRLLAKIECRMGCWSYAFDSWQKLGRQLARTDESEGSLSQLLDQWNEEALAGGIIEVSQEEVARLAEHALSAPGVVLGRALSRHWPDAVTKSGFEHTLDAAWRGLRNYLDQPCFVKALGGGERHYPESLKKAVQDGNLESVLDEQLWITTQLQGLAGSELADDLRAVLDLRNSNFFLHRVENPDQRFTLRCHAALPFTTGRVVTQLPGQEQEKPLRPDELRRAFNSPFWPHVLTTTSIGQEGLDFHCWCNRVVHWDLAYDPISHEQRQGRIQRYGGIGVRLAIANQLGPEIFSTMMDHGSPWKALASRAEKVLGDLSGMKPWWILPGAEIQNILFAVPMSEQETHFKWLQEQVLLYRLALGHPNQEDLLEVLQRDRQITLEQIRQSSLDLSAYFAAD
ncbi:MAG: helicase-related protein [Terriglobia bacterium]